jgi:hypothetical protein
VIYSDADLLAMLDPFAVDVIMQQGTSDEYSIRGIFNNPHKLYADNEVFSSTNPTLTVRTSDITNISKTTGTVYIDGTTRKIRDFESNGQGLTIIDLGKAQ